MTEPVAAAPRSRTTLDNVLLVVGAILTVVCGVPLLIFSYLTLSSRFGPPDADPHGYSLIFGTLFGCAFALATAVVVPLLFPGHLRLRAYGVSLLGGLLIVVGLFALLVTA